MAVQRIAWVEVPGGARVEWFVDYNAQNGRVRALTCTNPTSREAYGEIRHPDTGEVVGRTFPAQQNTERPAPQGLLRVRVLTDTELGEPRLEVEKNDGTWVRLPHRTGLH